MGKNKQAQRTKNNARPSSSSRSAELLGTSMPNFVGFSAVKDGGYVPILPGLSLYTSNDIEMTNVDQNFQIVLKKMHKKDATTKYKALQEFATMCQDSQLSAIEGMLPFWPKVYSALSIDTEHRVREAAQVAHAAVVKRVGKGIAMYLKQLAGPWFTSQYDTYPPAASAATNSFNNTFPEKKIVDAIVHCQREILSHICDNLTVQTPQTLSVQKNVNPDEMETKYQKILISNLQAYSCYFKKVPLADIEKMAETHNKIVSSAKFWKLARHETILIKTSFFSLLTSIIANANVVLQNEKKRTVTCIMNSMDETEPGLLSTIWESLLVVINHIEDWHLVVNMEKLVLPKLWRVLRNGGQYCASIVYPNLLPFLSQFPKLNINTDQLYANFFENMRQGLLLKSVQQSRSETFSVIVSFTECIRYSILLNINNSNLCEKLLKEQLMQLLETYIMEKTTMKQVLFCEITHLVRYWSKNRKKEEYKLYGNLVHQFWVELKTMFIKILNTAPHTSLSDWSDINNSQIELLLTLKNAPSHNRKALRVKFADPEECSSIKYQTNPGEANNDAVFLGELEEIVNELCIYLFEKINANDGEIYIEYFDKLIINFENKELFVPLLKAADVNTTLEFYNQVLKKWLFDKPEQIVHIVDIIFNIIKYMDDVNKEEVLNSLLEIDDVAILKNIVQCGLAKQNRKDAAIKKWCFQPRVTDILVNVAKELAFGTCTDTENDQNLILLAFETDENGEVLISAEGVNEISAIICGSLNERCETSLNHFTNLISSLVPLSWSHKHSTSGAKQMLETLFKLCIHEYCTNNDSSYMENMREVWKNGLLECSKKLASSEFIAVTERFATITWEALYSLHEKQSANLLVDIAVDFLEVVIRNRSDVDYIRQVLLIFLSNVDIKLWLREVTENVLYGEVISGNLYILNPEQNVRICRDILSINMNTVILDDGIEKCMIWASFNAKLLNNLCARIAENHTQNEDEDEDEYDFTECNSNNFDVPGITDVLLDIMYVCALGQTYSNHYKSSKYYTSVKKFLLSLKETLETLQKYLSPIIYEEILRHFETNWYEYGCMLPYIIQVYCTNLLPNTNPLEYLENCTTKNTPSVPEEANKTIQLQGVQVLCRHKKLSSIDLQTENTPETYILLRRSIDENKNDEMYINTLDKIIKSQKENDVLLRDCDISNLPWEKISLSLEVIRLLTQLVKTMPGRLTPKQWDFILISLMLWQLSIKKSDRSCRDFKVSALVVAVSQLYRAVQATINTQKAKPIDGFPPELLDEWKNVFATDIQERILQTWLLYADLCKEESTVVKSIIIMDNLGLNVTMLNDDIVFGEVFDKKSTTHFTVDEIMNTLLKLVQCPLPSIQLGAYHVLTLTIQSLVQRDSNIIQNEKFNPNSLSIIKFHDDLTHMQTIVNAILSDFKLCDTISCTIQPFTDSYTYTLGYLLVWIIVFEMCRNAQGDLRYQYAESLKKDLFPALLNNIFRLMPVEVLQDAKIKPTRIVEMFANAPSLHFSEPWTEYRLDHVVCWLYTKSLRHLPVLVRQWWSTADSKVSAAVDRITTNYVTPMLCQEELLNNRLTNFENMQVKVHPTVREVVALYEMDDTKLELNIILPSNYPLGPVVVEPGQHAGGTSNWKNCHMQLSIFLTHQNGSVWDGLLMWKRNLDKKFAGVEECYICFSIFHISTYQIPKLSCRTCRKKFHTPCLYKWFNTSQKSTCPICRNVF